MENAKKQTINSVKRAAIIIETLSHGPAGVREIARLTNYDKSSISRTLLTLEDTGFVTKANFNGKYMLSYKLFEIGNRSLSSFEFRIRLEPHLHELNRMTRETILVGVLLQNDILIIRKLRSLPEQNKRDNDKDRDKEKDFKKEKDLELVSEIGYRVPIHNSALGKALLSFLNPEQQEELLENITFRKTAKHTLQSKEELLHEVEQIRKRGYAVNDEELKNDIRAVAAPFFNYRHEVAGAVGITGLSSRMDPERLKDLGMLIVRFSNKISADLGCYNRV